MTHKQQVQEYCERSEAVAHNLLDRAKLATCPFEKAHLFALAYDRFAESARFKESLG